MHRHRWRQTIVRRLDRDRAEWNSKIGVVAEEADEACALVGVRPGQRSGQAAARWPVADGSQNCARSSPPRLQHHVATAAVKKINRSRSTDKINSTVQQLKSSADGGHCRLPWLGHSSFRLRTPGGKEILFDPWSWVTRPFPESAQPKGADLILISHGHSDHITDAAAMAKATGATVVGIWEVTSWLGSKSVKNLEPMNKGGTITVSGLRITMTDARHSSSADKDLTLSRRGRWVCGHTRKRPDVYYAGDTSLFGDMKLIAELYKPISRFSRSTIASRWAPIRRRWRRSGWA